MVTTGGAYGKGFKFLQEQKAKLPDSDNFDDGDFPRVWLLSGELAKIVFVTPHTEIAMPFIHSLQRMSQKGKKWFPDILCNRTTVEDKGDELGEDGKPLCDLCVTEDKRSWFKGLAFVWIDWIMHTTLPSYDGKSPDWEEVKIKGNTFYQENVQAVRVITLKPRMIDQLREWIEGDPLAELTGEETEGGDLLAQPMLWRKKGIGKDTKETIVPTKESLPAVAVAARQQMESESLGASIQKLFGQQRLGGQGAVTLAEGSGGGATAGLAAEVTAEDDAELLNVADVEDTSATVVDFEI